MKSGATRTTKDEHEHRFWITPPDVKSSLDSRFHFTHEICKCPPENNDLFTDWGPKGSVVHGNPPFRRKDGSPTAFVRKAIEQAKGGRTIILTLPTQSYVNLALESGAKLESLKRVKWLCVDCGKPMPGPSPTTAFIWDASTASDAALADLPEAIWDNDCFQDGLEMVRHGRKEEQFSAYTTILQAIKYEIEAAKSRATQEESA